MFWMWKTRTFEQGLPRKEKTIDFPSTPVLHPSESNEEVGGQKNSTPTFVLLLNEEEKEEFYQEAEKEGF